MARPADPHARSALIAAARRVFHEQGIQRARIEDITAACGLSKGAFYLHFESKEALFAELVKEFEHQMDVMFEQRMAEEDAFFAKRGPFRSRDFTERTARLDELEGLQTRHDNVALELMWNMRDVIHVLINGAQGTAFDGVIWQAIDREQQRVVLACDRLKKFGAIRTDLKSDIIAMSLMGVWVLLMRQMVSRDEKPNFPSIIAELNRLVGEGLAPRAPVRKSGRKSSAAPAVSVAHRRAPSRVSLRKAP